ncbi:MAG: helix-turn-helix domain-containing protein [Myxococcales bacterium]|nr:helix-turn-helix domain-containing protein [Myxococcales bacterium]
MTNDKNIERLMSHGDTALTLCISSRQLRRLVQRGQLPTVRIGRRVLYRPADIQAFVTGHIVEGGHHA